MAERWQEEGFDSAEEMALVERHAEYSRVRGDFLREHVVNPNEITEKVIEKFINDMNEERGNEEDPWNSAWYFLSDEELKRVFDEWFEKLIEAVVID